MALPFVLGLAVGATAVLAYKNSDKIKEILNKGFDKTKENVEEFKETVEATKECIKSKKSKPKSEEAVDDK